MLAQLILRVERTVAQIQKYASKVKNKFGIFERLRISF
jgi:hypothetical protein